MHGNSVILKKFQKLKTEDTILQLSHVYFSGYTPNVLESIWNGLPSSINAINLDYCFLGTLSFEQVKTLIENIPVHIESVSLRYNFLHKLTQLKELIAFIPRHITQLNLSGNFLYGHAVFASIDTIAEFLQALPPGLKRIDFEENSLNALKEESFQFFLDHLPLELEELKIENVVVNSVSQHREELYHQVQVDVLEHRDHLLTDAIYYINNGMWMPRAHVLNLIEDFRKLATPEAMLLQAYLYTCFWYWHASNESDAEQFELKAIQHLLMAANSPLLLNIVQYQLWHRAVTTPFQAVKQQLNKIHLEPPVEFVGTYQLFSESKRPKIAPSLEEYIHHFSV